MNPYFFVRSKFSGNSVSGTTSLEMFGQHSPVSPKQSSVVIASGKILVNKIQKSKASVLLTSTAPNWHICLANGLVLQRNERERRHAKRPVFTWACSPALLISRLPSLSWLENRLQLYKHCSNSLQEDQQRTAMSTTSFNEWTAALR